MKTSLQMQLSGLLINDLTGHLPIFAVFQNDYGGVVDKRPCIFARKKTQEAIIAFRDDLKQQTWNEVYVEDPNKAYNAFSEIFLELYDKCCLLQKISGKNKFD